MNEKLWELFKLTGDIKYYLMYKRLEEGDTSEDESKSDSYQ